MSSYYEIIDQKTEMLTELLTESFASFGYDVREDYSRTEAENPVSRPVLTVGMHSMHLDDSASNAFLGKNTETNLNVFARMITVTYRITVHASALLAYTACRSCAAVISQACIGYFDVVDVKSSEPKYDRKCRCVVMPVDLTVRLFV